MQAVRFIAVLLMVIGSINWGLVGLFRFDVVARILGSGIVTDIIYVLIGVAGVWGISLLTSGRESKGPAPVEPTEQEMAHEV